MVTVDEVSFFRNLIGYGSLRHYIPEVHCSKLPRNKVCVSRIMNNYLNCIYIGLAKFMPIE